MIDMHDHILFGVDDGAETVEDSLKLIHEEVKKGVSHIILTPHYKSMDLDMERVLLNYEALKEQIAKKNLEVSLHIGNEIFFGSDFYDFLEKGGFKTLAGSDYILIEFSMMDTPKNIPEMCYEARIKGYVPIIAHVERYDVLHDNISLLKEILNESALLQVNASSVIGKEDKKSCKFTNYLLKNELVSFVASDVHNMTTRGFYLDEAYKTVKKSYGTEYADRIFYLNQNCILSNKYFDAPKLNNSGDRLLSKLFRNNR